MSLDYIRRTYGVPAKRGAQVMYDGQPGRIIGTRAALLRVRILGDRFARLIHPTDDALVYAPVITAPQSAIEVQHDGRRIARHDGVRDT